MGETLNNVKEISVPGAPLKDSVFIASTNIDTWASGPTDAKAVNGDSFKTDTDLSNKPGSRRERELTVWTSDTPNPIPSVTFGIHGDDVTFGPGASNGSWDQFAMNEALFGVKTSFNEKVYTTKLDRSEPDHRGHGRKAQQITNEIMGPATNDNAHVHEERTMGNAGDNGTNEEDKYAGVTRGADAYIPPGARKAGVIGETPQLDIPKVSINGPDGTTVAHQPSTSNGSTPIPAVSTSDPVVADPRKSVNRKKQRPSQMRQAVLRAERDKWTADFDKFSQTFKLKKSIPVTTSGLSAVNQSPKPNPTEPVKPNPLFGIPIKETTVVRIEDDFNPFKYVKVIEASVIGMSNHCIEAPMVGGIYA
ncbi:hypothetical protein BDM02DRAFT_3173795 [Thelephora ganbajun]|uniref:Uncharacterized protein n=1 Tax=Thelephora ganbajun TaxID=370292 RepID=A0ACB6Z627_THEGA|nr:hypothetical protein BDM02DRAFT_3173795 [Thelephora ganbajun]